MCKWLEYKLDLNVKNNFGKNGLPSELKLIVGLARRFRIDFINFRRKNNGF